MLKNVLSWIEQGKSAPSQRIVEVLEKKTEGRKKRKFTSILSITDPLILGEADTEQVRPISARRLPYLCMQQLTCECDSASFGSSGKRVIANHSEWKHVAAEHSDEEKDVGKDPSSKICPDHNGSFSLEAFHT